MPVPKRKTSKSRRDRRASTKFIRPKAIAKCQNCEFPISSHQACQHCGFYKGKKVMTTKLDRSLKRGVSKKSQDKNLYNDIAGTSSSEEVNETASKE